MLLLLILFLLLSGCANNTTEIEFAEYEPDSESLKKESVNIENHEVLRKAFENNSEFNFEKLYIIKSLKTSHYCHLILMEQSDSLCAEFFLVALCDSSITDIKTIGKNCDHDLSIPVHEWTEILSGNDNVIIAAYMIQYVNDSFLNDFGFPPDKHFYDFPIEVDTLKIFKYSTDTNGNIIMGEKDKF